jgi:hypothetical protein
VYALGMNTPVRRHERVRSIVALHCDGCVAFDINDSLRRARDFTPEPAEVPACPDDRSRVLTSEDDPFWRSCCRTHRREREARSDDLPV